MTEVSAAPEAILDMDILKEGLPGITPAIGTLFAEASLLCFHQHGHPVGTRLIIDGTFKTSHPVIWSDAITEQTVDAWQDQQEATEFGACGIAILLVLKLTSYTVIRRAVKGDGIDYWFGKQDAQPPFQNAARLEISGILTGDDSAIRRRLREKQAQTTPTDGLLPAHVVIVEFSSPLAHYLVKL